MSAEANKAVLRQGARAFNNPTDRSGWLGIHDPTVVAHGLGPETLDRDGLEQFYQGLWTAFPDLCIAIEDMIAEGDRVAWRLSVEGTHRAEFRGVPATGRQIVFAAQYIFRFQDGRVVERWTNFDRLGVLIQIGAVPSPV